MDYPDRIKTKKTTINPINKKEKGFQYTVTVFLESTKLKIVWKKITTFFKRPVSIIL